MSGEQIERKGNPRARVYDLLGTVNEVALPRALELFTLAGQIGHLCDGYFYEKTSSDMLQGWGSSVVSDENGVQVGVLHNGRAGVGAAFYGEVTHDWIEGGKRYRVTFPEIDDEQLDALKRIRREILERLNYEGEEAAEEFRLIGDLMGGQKIDPKLLAKDIQTRIDKMVAGLRTDLV